MAHKTARKTDSTSEADVERLRKLLDSEGRKPRPARLTWDAKARRIVYLDETGAEQQHNVIVTHDDMQMD